jgi:hypothetical protein
MSVDHIMSNMWKLFTGTSPFASDICWMERKAIDMSGITSMNASGIISKIISASRDDIFIRTKSTTMANRAKSIEDPINAAIFILNS